MPLLTNLILYLSLSNFIRVKIVLLTIGNTDKAYIKKWN